MKKYTTVTETLNKLKQEGYTLDFNLKSGSLECKTLALQLRPADFLIDKFYRFEGESNPGDSAIIYAISSKNGSRGTMIDAYGIYADSLTSEMLEKLRIAR